MATDPFPWRLYGGAARDDAISGLDPRMTQALMALYAAAPPEVQRELGLNSAYRSIQRQQELWDASDKTGRTVAAPGRSKHNHGAAVDLYGFGLGGKLNTVSQETRDWVAANLGKFGLTRPMDYEPWHVQLADAAGGTEMAMKGGYPAAPNQQQGPAMPKSITNYSPENRRNAIAAIESAGSGDYGALGPWIARRNASGPNAKDRAYGRYQVMGSNIPEWTKQVLGRAMTPEEFVANPKAQDAVFDKIFGDYVRKHGEEGAASMWFTGRPDAVNAKDVLGTSGGQYIKKYMDALAGQTANGMTYNYPDQAQVDATGGAAGAGGAPVDPNAKKEDKFSVDDFMANLGDVAGGMGGGGGSVSQGTRLNNPMQASMAQSLGGYTTTGSMTPEQAQGRLQLALQRLNSRKLV